ncbi:MAG: hypothetical protein U0790_16150 [Isosphaeraceae bacterium]
MSSPTYFDRLRGSVTRIARHAYFPGKEDAVEQCLEEIEQLRDAERITRDEFSMLREILAGREDRCPVEAVTGLRERAESSPESGGVAIVCQGVGSQAAFSAGVLQGLLNGSIQRGRICALGGYSFGAVNALLAWEGLLRGDLARGVDQVQQFWDQYSASSLIETFLNYSCQMIQHLRSAVSLSGPGPTLLGCSFEELLRGHLERQIDFGLLRALATIEGAPKLAIGRDAGIASRCLRGEDISLDGFLATVAGPGPHLRGDGPGGAVGDEAGRVTLLRTVARCRPSEVWLIQINRVGRPGDGLGLAEPLVEAQAAENLLIELELDFIRRINALLDRGSLIDGRYRNIEVHQIVMEHDLDEASKSDRSPSFIGSLMSYGRERARQFLERRDGVLPRRSRVVVGR